MYILSNSRKGYVGFNLFVQYCVVKKTILGSYETVRLV